MPNTDLKRFDLTDIGRGPWHVVQDLSSRSMNAKNKKSKYTHRVYYGTRTQRSEEDARVQATALCALLNFLRAKRP